MPVKISKEEFISRSNLIHNNKYDYSKVEYVNSTTKVCIICPEHGEFWQLPKLHMSGAGCKKCAINKRNDLTRYTTETFITKAHEVHGDRYDYSKVKYISNHNIKVCIICHEHGEFWQTPKNHLHGSGCPKCKTSKLELNVMSFLEKNSIEYLYNKELEWTDKLRLDFYIPNKNIVIECQGVQHYEPRDFAGKGYNWAKKEFELIQERDKRKFELCSLNNKKIIYINNINEINDKLSWII